MSPLELEISSFSFSNLPQIEMNVQVPKVLAGKEFLKIGKFKMDSELSLIQ